MIVVQELTKQYGSVMAVDRLSFQIGRGEIVGLLGPNGAGKTTTMRMLTTYLAPTSGRAVLAGHDVLDAPSEVRRHMGYLPESVPLYLEMRVKEYLRYRARLKDVPRSQQRLAISEVISRCRLAEVENRILGHLSRGYRQRVGLADALLHEPDILILDEPTSGLDPMQIREVRSLIKEMGSRHTILLSTHIMSEVEAVCDRVIIIAKGRIAVDERLESLRRENTILVEARGPSDAIRSALSVLPGVQQVAVVGQSDGYATLEVVPRNEMDPREAIAQKLVSSGWPPRMLETRRGSLEERFVEAVTRENRVNDLVEVVAS